MKKYLLILMSLIVLFLTGCNYSVSNNITIIDDDILLNDIWVTQDYLYENQAPDIKNLMSYLINLDKYKITNEENFVGIKSQQLKFSDIKYIKKTTTNGVTSLEITIPPLILYKNSSDEYEGATIYFYVHLDKKFTYIESNSLDIETNKSGEIIAWELSPKILSRGTTLTLKYKKK